MKKYIFFYILFLLGGCVMKRYPPEMVVESITIDSRDKMFATYVLERSGEYIYLVDSLGMYNVGDTLIIKKQ